MGTMVEDTETGQLLYDPPPPHPLRINHKCSASLKPKIVPKKPSLIEPTYVSVVLKKYRK